MHRVFQEILCLREPPWTLWARTNRLFIRKTFAQAFEEFFMQNEDFREQIFERVCDRFEESYTYPNLEEFLKDIIRSLVPSHSNEILHHMSLTRQNHEEKRSFPQPLIHTKPTTYPDMVLSPFPRGDTAFIHDLKSNKEFEDTMDSLLYNIGWGVNITPPPPRRDSYGCEGEFARAFEEFFTENEDFREQVFERVCDKFEESYNYPNLEEFLKDIIRSLVPNHSNEILHHMSLTRQNYEEKGPFPQPLIHTEPTTYPDMTLSPFPRGDAIFIHDLKEDKEFEDTMDSLLHNIGWSLNTAPPPSGRNSYDCEGKVEID